MGRRDGGRSRGIGRRGGWWAVRSRRSRPTGRGGWRSSTAPTWSGSTATRSTHAAPSRARPGAASWARAEPRWWARRTPGGARRRRSLRAHGVVRRRPGPRRLVHAVGRSARHAVAERRAGRPCVRQRPRRRDPPRRGPRGVVADDRRRRGRASGARGPARRSARRRGDRPRARGESRRRRLVVVLDGRAPRSLRPGRGPGRRPPVHERLDGPARGTGRAVPAGTSRRRVRALRRRARRVVRRQHRLAPCRGGRRHGAVRDRGRPRVPLPGCRRHVAIGGRRRCASPASAWPPPEARRLRCRGRPEGVPPASIARGSRVDRAARTLALLRRRADDRVPNGSRSCRRAAPRRRRSCRGGPGAVAVVWADWQSCSDGRSCSTPSARSTRSASSSCAAASRARRTRGASTSGWTRTSRSRAAGSRATRRSSARSG